MTVMEKDIQHNIFLSSNLKGEFRRGYSGRVYQTLYQIPLHKLQVVLFPVISLCIAMHSPVVFLHCFWALHRLFHTDQLYITKLHWQQSLHICSRLNNKQVPLYSRASTIGSCVTQGRTKCIFPQISSALLFSFMLYFIKEFQNPFLFGENFWPFFVCTTTVFVCFGLQKNVNTTM